MIRQRFRTNRDTYYSLGRYLGYTDLSLSRIESQKDPLSWILCDTAVKTSPNDILELVSTLEQYFIKYRLWENFHHFIIHNGFSSLLTFFIRNYINIMEKLFLELEKTVDNFNNVNETKGFRAEYSLWNRTHNTVLCQIIVTCIPDKVIRDKFILLDTKLDI